MVSGPRSGVGWSAVERPMNASAVVVVLEFVQLALKVTGSPERDEVEKFLPGRPDEPFDEGVGERHIRDGFDLLDFKDP